MSKIILAGILFLFLNSVCNGQERKYSRFYEQRASLFEILPISDEDIVFLGNSITNGCEWSELFNNPRIKNRGISGDIALGVYDRLQPIVQGKPAKIFLLIGINDVSRGMPADTIVGHIDKIIDKIQQESPHTRIYLQNLLPTNDCYGMFGSHTSRNDTVVAVNKLLPALAHKKHIIHIDLWSHFADPVSGKMNPEYTNDGLHLLGKGYLLWRDIVLPYIGE